MKSLAAHLFRFAPDGRHLSGPQELRRIKINMEFQVYVKVEPFVRALSMAVLMHQAQTPANTEARKG